MCICILQMGLGKISDFRFDSLLKLFTYIFMYVNSVGADKIC